MPIHFLITSSQLLHITSVSTRCIPKDVATMKYTGYMYPTFYDRGYSETWTVV